MSQNTTRCTKGAEITDPGGFARHAQACDVCERGAADPNSAENGGFRASDMLMDEIPAAIKHADADTLDATLALHGHEPAPTDTRETAAAKALILAKSGGKEAYATVFGRCAEDGCAYGANGFRANACKTHGGESASTRSGEPAETPETDDSEPETPDSPNPYADAEPEREPTSVDTDALPPRAKIVAELVKSRGLEPETAENAASYVYELVDAGLDPREAGAAAAQRYA